MKPDTRTMWKFAVTTLAVSALLALGMWWLLESISDSTHIRMADELEDVGTWLLWVSAIGQTGFVLTWATLPWWSHWVGRALMIKSVTLMVYLDIALVFHYVTPFPAMQLMFVILFTFVVFGIWSQFGAILWERLKRARVTEN